jgi:YD repeat-containing protein
VTREHDSVGRDISETVNGRISAYTYDAMGRRTQRTTPSGLCSEWIHDPAGRPTGLSSGAGTMAFTYDAAGRETERRIGDDTTLTSDGTLAWQPRTTLWGTPLPAPAGRVDCPLRFPGQYAGDSRPPRPGNRPQLQPLPALRRRNRPLHHAGPARVGSSAQRIGVCS